MTMDITVDVLRNNPTADAFDRIARSRWSCRDYRPDQVGAELLKEILDVAQTTASWCNTQPWQIEMTRGRATTEFIEALAVARADPSDMPDFEWPEYEGIYLQRRRESGFQLYEALGISRHDKVRRDEQADKNFKLFGAPHVAIVTTDARLGVYGAIDCGGWVANFMLAAKSRGVASIAQASLARYPNFIRRHFSLDRNRLVVCGISFGFPDEASLANAYRTSRASVDQAVHMHE
jgi:nitroreductase